MGKTQMQAFSNNDRDRRHNICNGINSTQTFIANRCFIIGT